MSLPSIRIAASGAFTAFGDEAETLAALLAGRRALEPRPVHGAAGGDLVPIALCAGRAYDETLPPSWLPYLRDLAARIPAPEPPPHSPTPSPPRSPSPPSW